MVLTQIAVLIPFIGMRHLYEAHALLRKPPGQQTLMPKISRLRVIQAIQLFSCLSLTRYFLKLRSRKLHPIRKLKRTQPALKPRIRPRMAKLTLAQIANHLQLKLLSRQGRFRILDKWNLCLITRDTGIANRSPLRPRWQESRAPVVHTAMRQCWANR